ncbi:hypothetical protein Tco_1578321, partial [Tanacetum coccineum]
KDEDPSAGSDRGLKRRKTSKDADPTTKLKKKDSMSDTSKGTKSQPRSSGKSVQSEEPVFEVADSDMPDDQEGNLGDNEDEPRNFDYDVHNVHYQDKGRSSMGDVYLTKRILAVTHVSVMRKYGYGYLEDIVVRRADNLLYRFKEGDDVTDFAIALRIYTRSLVIQRRVEDLQLSVESYQKQINVTKPDTTRPDLRKRHLLALILYKLNKNVIGLISLVK